MKAAVVREFGQPRYPGLVIDQVEASVPEQYQQLTDGRLDVGVGRAALAPPQIASLLFRQDPLGDLVPTGHPFAELEGVSVAELAAQPLLLDPREDPHCAVRPGGKRARSAAKPTGSSAPCQIPAPLTLLGSNRRPSPSRG